MAYAIYTSFVCMIDSNGIPLSSARVFVLDAGSTSLKTIYSDAGLSTPATNPIVVTSGGPHDMRYVAAGTYKIQVETGGSSTLNSGTVVARYSKDNVDSGVAVGSGALPIASGGTSATSAAAAISALGAASASSLATTAADVASLQSTLTGTDSTQLASGTTAQRDVVPAAGMVRENTTTTKFEGYISGGWDNFMLEAANAAATADVLAETAGATFIRPDRLSYSKRVIRCAALVTYSGGVPALTNGFGFTATVADNGTGDFTLNFSVTEADANYAFFACPFINGTALLASATAKSTTQLRVTVFNSAGSATDPTSCAVIVMRFA